MSQELQTINVVPHLRYRIENIVSNLSKLNVKKNLI
jgi:hypothetical protein